MAEHSSEYSCFFLKDGWWEIRREIFVNWLPSVANLKKRFSMTYWVQKDQMNRYSKQHNASLCGERRECNVCDSVAVWLAAVCSSPSMGRLGSTYMSAMCRLCMLSLNKPFICGSAAVVIGLWWDWPTGLWLNKKGFGWLPQIFQASQTSGLPGLASSSANNTT